MHRRCLPMHHRTEGTVHGPNDEAYTSDRLHFSVPLRLVRFVQQHVGSIKGLQKQQEEKKNRTCFDGEILGGIVLGNYQEQQVLIQENAYIRIFFLSQRTFFMNARNSRNFSKTGSCAMARMSLIW